MLPKEYTTKEAGEIRLMLPIQVKDVVNEYIKPVNDCFEKHECLKCGAIHEKEGTDQVQGFF